MYLINVRTLRLEEFISDEVAPPYAILSHTWGKEEVSFQEFIQEPRSETTLNKAGYQKICKFCETVTAMGHAGMSDFEPISNYESKLDCIVDDQLDSAIRSLDKSVKEFSSSGRLSMSLSIQYGWVDTCCIDKKSSAELSEAINSMYRWYSQAHVCLVYLADVMPSSPIDRQGQLMKSRWFTRGWTLQELLAPDDPIFFDSTWMQIGTKSDLEERISEATHISIEHLRDRYGASVATRMSWASRRKTTRIEDTAYCLMGLFRVNMPLLYGEGRRAFSRLQQEIILSNFDESIFAWKSSLALKSGGILASSPADFRDSAGVQVAGLRERRSSPFVITSFGLQMDLKCRQADDKLIVRLNCGLNCDPKNKPGTDRHYVKIALLEFDQNWYLRQDPQTLQYWSDEDDDFGPLVQRRIYVGLNHKPRFLR